MRLEEIQFSPLPALGRLLPPEGDPPLVATASPRLQPKGSSPGPTRASGATYGAVDLQRRSWVGDDPSGGCGDLQCGVGGLEGESPGEEEIEQPGLGFREGAQDLEVEDEGDGVVPPWEDPLQVGCLLSLARGGVKWYGEAARARCSSMFVHENGRMEFQACVGSENAHYIRQVCRCEEPG